MRKKKQRTLASLLAFVMVSSSIFVSDLTKLSDVKAQEGNLALNKEVTVSGLEVSDGRFTADKAVDGIVDKDSRVSFAKNQDEQWMNVDLGEAQTISFIRINYESQCPQFKVQVSEDGETYTDVYLEENGGNQTAGIVECSIAPVKARYVKYVQLKRWQHSGNGQWYSGSIYEFEVYAEDPNAENVNLALYKDAQASALEVNDGRFTADKAVDGIVTKESRVSFAKDKDEQWLLVDLGEEKTVSYVVLNYESQVAHYKIQVSNDGETFTDVYETTDAPSGTSGIQKISFDPVKARYVRYLQLTRWQHTNNQKYSGSIYEFEIYAHAPTRVESAQDALEALKGKAPTISENGKSIILPEVAEGYEISLYGSDNRQVITMDGEIIQPLVDMSVNLLYKVVNVNDPDDVATSEKDVKITIPGKYTPAAEDNAKPNVIPGLREWKGESGNFTLTDSSRIVYNNDEVKETAEMIQSYLDEMCHFKTEVVKGVAQDGDIELIYNDDTTLGEEGYDLVISDKITVKAPTLKGILYGGVTVTQVASQSEDLCTLPKGIARDYPKYEVRAGMIDVGRMYIPLEYLQEITTYMAWFKMNEVQVHINDYWGASKYSAFRLESETYPMIMAQDGTYSKEDYKQYQKDMKKLGIDVITEIDTPYHSEAFREVPGIRMLGAGSLDITTDEAFNANKEIIENLFDEYLDGEDPVFQSGKFHIGTDEYDKRYSEQMRKWTDHFINYVNDKGYETRLWASLGSKGFNGTTPVSTDATMNLWAPYWADVKETYAAGYDIINTEGGWLYIVPGGNAGYANRYDMKKIYEGFEVNNFQSARSGTNGTAIMPFAHPQTKGASFALWNDMTTFRGGFSEFDIYDRVKDAIVMLSEKTWFGEKAEGQTADEFLDRISKVEDKVPGANPARWVESKSSLVAAYDFEDGAVDYSGNYYNGIIENGTIVDVDGESALKLDGEGYFSLPFGSLGYPYTVSMDVYLDGNNDDAVLFSGKDGTFYVNIEESGNVGFARSGYNFRFNYTLPKNQWVNLTFTSDASNTTLFADGKSVGTAINMETSKRKDSTTSVLPTEKIGENMKGMIKDIKLYNVNQKMSDTKIPHANMTPSASSSHNADRGPDKAIDDNADSSWSAAQNQSLPQSITLEFDQTYQICKYEYLPKRVYEDGQITKYILEVSTDGENFEEAASGTWGADFDLKTVEFAPVEAKYIRLTALEGVGNQAAAGEINVYYISPEASALRNAIAQGKALVKEHSDDYTENSLNAFKAALNEAKRVDTAAENQDELVKALSDLCAAKEELVSIAALREAVESAEALNAGDYTEASFAALKEAVEDARALYIDGTKEAVAEALTAIQNAVAALEKVEEPGETVSKKTLEYFLNKAKEHVANGDTEEVDQSVKELFAEAIAEGDAMMAKADATREEVMNATIKLMYAIHALDMKFPSADKTALEMAMEVARMIELDKYVDAGKKEFSDALANGQNVLDDEDATQEEVDQAWNDLVEAMHVLRFKADKNILEDLLKQAEGLDLSQYTDESVQAFRAVFARAQAVMADDTLSEDDQKIVDEAVKALQAAKAELVLNDYSTDKPDDSKKDESKKDTSNAPKTGDHVPVMFMFLLLISAGVVLMLKKREEER